MNNDKPERAMDLPYIGKNWPKEKNKKKLTVVIVNMDLSGSSLLKEAYPYAWDLLDNVNQLQDDIQQILEGDNWWVGEWSGDGLVALFLDTEGKSDEPINRSKMVISKVKEWREKCKRDLPTDQGDNLEERIGVLEKVNIRIGVRRGEICWYHPHSKRGKISTGRIISPYMNEAGHLQKECDTGALMIDEATRNNISDPQLKKQFPDSHSRRIIHGTTELKAYQFEVDEGYEKVEPIEKQILHKMKNCDIIAKAPGACYFFGEFAVIFGHIALIQPLPLYIYVGINVLSEDNEQIKVELKPGLAVKPEINLYDEKSCESLNIENDFECIQWDTVKDHISSIITSRFSKNKSKIIVNAIALIPNRCGLNASSALSMALATALTEAFEPESLKEALEYISTIPVDSPIHIESDDAFSKLVKFAWELDNIFHRGASSGCGVTASAIGANDGHPLIYITEGRGFQGPYPMFFSNSTPENGSINMLRRFRALAYRTGNIHRDAKNLKHEYAIFYTIKRGDTESTGDIIEKFLSANEFKGNLSSTIKDLLEKTHTQGHKYYMSRSLLAKAFRYDSYGTIESLVLPNKKQIPRVSELLVESFADALGICSVAGISAFVNYSFDLQQWCVFANCMNAYQELMCACGMSGVKAADLFNYRSDAFSYTYGEEKRPFGSKLTGAGRGGDFVVVATKKDLSSNFETFRHEMKIDGKPLYCHFTSWAHPEGRGKVYPKVEGVKIIKSIKNQA